jgi:mono/diheme cytochrome c family protein
MRQSPSKWILLAAVVVLAACQPASDPVVRGEKYFDALGCAKCHQIGEKGGTWGPNLTLIGVRKSPEWLELWLKNPHAWRKETVMPNFNLTDSARADIVSFLSSQKGQAWAQTGKPWDEAGLKGVHRGEVLFNKAGCVACHAQNGRGGYPNNNVAGNMIPSLAKVSEGYTKQELMAKIRNGVKPTPNDPSQPAPMVFMPKWGEVLKNDEISDVADYLISLGKNAPHVESKDDF